MTTLKLFIALSCVLESCSGLPIESTDAGRDVNRDVQRDLGGETVIVIPPDIADVVESESENVDAANDRPDDNQTDTPPTDACSGTICDNQCVNTSVDPLNCGGCGNSCIGTSLMGHDECRDSACIFVCNPGYANCGEDTFCRTDISDRVNLNNTAVMNCGACDRTCPVMANGVSQCLDGFCRCTGSERCGNWGHCVGFRCIPD